MLSSRKRREGSDPKQLIILESGAAPGLHKPSVVCFGVRRVGCPAAQDFLYPRFGGASDERVLDVVDCRGGVNRGGAVDGDLLSARRRDRSRLWRRSSVAGLERALSVAHRGRVGHWRR